MQFDIPSIILMIAISNGITVCVLFFQYYLNKKFKGFIEWVIAFSLLALSQIFAVYEINNEKISGLIADVLLAGGFAFLSIGFKTNLQLNKKTGIHTLLVIPLLIESILYLFHNYILIQQGVLLLTIAVYASFITYDAYKKYTSNKNKILLLTVYSFSVYVILFTIQAVVDFITYKNVIPLDDNELLTIVYVTSLIMSLFGTFSFMLLINQQLIKEQEITEKSLQLNQQILLDAQNIASLGNYVHHLATDTWETSAEFNKIFNVQPNQTLLNQDAINLLGPKYINWINTIKNEPNYFEKSITLHLEQFDTNKNATKWLIGFGKVIFDNNNYPTHVIGTIQDITTQKLAELEMLEKSQQFEILFNSSPEAAMISVIPSGMVVAVNHAFVKLSGFSEQETVSKTSLDLNVWVSLDEREIYLAEIKAKGAISNKEIKFRRKDGEIRFCKLSGKMCTIKGVPHLISMIDDISERKAIEESLHLKNYAISNSSDAVFWVKNDASFFDMNTAACKLFKNTREVLLQKTVLDIDPNFDKEKWKSHWEEVKQKKNVIFTTQNTVNNNEVIISEINANYIEYNGVELMCSFVRNITDRIQAEAEKEKARLDHEALISSTPDLMWSIDKNYKLIAGNKAFIETIKNDANVTLMVGDDVLLEDKFPQAFVEYWRILYQKAFDGEDVKEEIFIPKEVSNESRWTSITINPIFNNQEITGIACFSRNITEQKEQQEKLSQLANELQQRADELNVINKELEQFAFIASHDLQEPLRMVKSFLELIEKRYQNKLDDDGKKYIQFAIQGSNRMRQVILDLLNYSRVGKDDADEELIDLNEVLNEILENNQLSILEKQAIITKQQLPTVKTVRLHMQQLLHNLISNGLKYAKPGTSPIINISVTEINNQWQFAISDNGIGIEPKFYDKIFVVFQRLHGTGTYSGTGIGLAICKKIIEKMGGKIWVESSQGMGSTFYFTINK